MGESIPSRGNSMCKGTERGTTGVLWEQVEVQRGWIVWCLKEEIGGPEG